MRYLAIDLGSRRIGLAISDQLQTLASPLGVLRPGPQLVDQVGRIIKEQSVGAVVVGLPLNMDGTEGPQAKKVREFAEVLARRIDVPIYLQDERLTSFAAEERLGDWPLSRAKKQVRVDAVAAAEILEAFLERLRK